MSEHTPEPWKGDNCGDYIFDANGDIIAQVRGWGHLEKKLGESGAEAEQIAIQRRIVACVNALKGVKTESLEEAVALGISDVTTGNLFSSRLKLTRERDEARAMVAELAKALVDQHWALVHDGIIMRHGHKDEDDFEIHEREHPNCPHCALLARVEALHA